jgi:hypothetical protein
MKLSINKDLKMKIKTLTKVLFDDIYKNIMVSHPAFNNKKLFLKISLEIKLVHIDFHGSM